MILRRGTLISLFLLCGTIAFSNESFNLQNRLDGLKSNMMQSDATDIDFADAVVEVDLHEGWRRQRNEHVIGIQMTMADGWKTYWRSPGPTGFPLQIDWSKSENIDFLEIIWPEPELLTNFGGTFAGYERSVLFPVKVNPLFSEESIHLNAKLLFGVCKDVCIPFQLFVTGELPADSTEPDHDIQHALEMETAVLDSSILEPDYECSFVGYSDRMIVRTSLTYPDLDRTIPFIAAYEHLSAQIIFEPAQIDWIDDQSFSVSSRIKMMNDSVVAIDRSELLLTLISRNGSIGIVGC